MTILGGLVLLNRFHSWSPAHLASMNLMVKSFDGEIFYLFFLIYFKDQGTRRISGSIKLWGLLLGKTD